MFRVLTCCRLSFTVNDKSDATNDDSLLKRRLLFMTFGSHCKSFGFLTAVTSVGKAIGGRVWTHKLKLISKTKSAPQIL